MSKHIGARKQSIIVAVNLTPDVCLTPVGGAMVPVPYAISVTLAGSTKVTPSVRFNRAPAYVYGHSLAPPVKGDEPGTGGGRESHQRRDQNQSQQISQALLHTVTRSGTGSTRSRAVYQGMRTKKRK